MYIERIAVEGFKNFVETEIEFSEGVNVIIGHNNAGKTNLLKALALIFDQEGSRRLDVDDFNKHIDLPDLQVEPPKVTITVTISQSKDEDLMSDDLVTIAPWLVSLETPYKALLTYEFFLPASEHQEYTEKLAHATDVKGGWLIIKHDFLRKYVYKIYGGKPELQSVADTEAMRKFDYQFLPAIRDVERDMFTGRNTLLREVIDFFMDYEIKSDTQKAANVKLAEIKTHKQHFSGVAQTLIEQLRTRLKPGTVHVMKYATDTGASFNGTTPKFDGQLSEAEFYSTLKLIIEYATGLEIPATHNGLGYNNLLFMSLLLAKMQVDTDGSYLASNAKVFPMLLIEEPEAHLHPSLQYKFLKFLQESTMQKARQIFVTSHSPNITAAVYLDQIICMHEVEPGEISIGYPGKVFLDDDDGRASKNYVQRFLDATRSDMLFAKNVVLVEGLAEQLMMPTMAKYCMKSLEDTHTTVIHVGGRYFNHFLKLFDTNHPKAINKKVACITDRDPVRKKKAGGEKSMQCYPFELNADPTNYDYSFSTETNIQTYSAHPNIRFFSQDVTIGKTFEYDLMLHNPGCTLLLTEGISNKMELLNLYVEYGANGKTVNTVKAQGIMRASDENDRILDGLIAVSNNPWDENVKFKSLLASRYLNSIDKGSNALELSFALEKNLKEKNCSEIFWVPDYIKKAIHWVCQ